MRYASSLMIAPETIDKIRDSANLGEIVGESVKLERKGRSLTGLCPFHKEKSPSFNVNEDRGFYHCFGCKASGDVFKFVQETEGLTFIEAVRNLAERLGIDVEDDLSAEDRRRKTAEKRQKQGLYEVNATAAGFFQSMLETHRSCHLAQDELKRRSLSMEGSEGEILRSFQIGYAPDSWDELTEFLKKAGHDLRSAQSVGLIAPRRQGNGYYDRFRHRLMFAVLDLHGRVVAFSGRALPPIKTGSDDPPAKYINSPESPIYQKRATVFGLYQARSELRSGKACIVVEGNFDVVSLHAKGFTQTVAPLGTAFTLEQGKQIRRFTNQVTLLFDGDNAGRKAARSSRAPAKEAGLSARVATLPDGIDPDDFARSRGAEGLKNLLGAARGMLDHLIAEILDENFAAADAEGQAKRIQDVIELLKSEDDPNVSALAEQHADRLAARLGVADAHTFRALRKSIRKSLQSPPTRQSQPEPPYPIEQDNESLGYDPRDEELSMPGKSTGGHERTLGLCKAIFGVFLDFPVLLESEEVLAYGAHMEGDIAAAVACLRGTVDVDTPRADMHNVVERLPGFLRHFARERLAAPLHEDISVARVELFANLDKLRQMDFTRLSSTTLNEIERARQEGDYDQELELLKELQMRARHKRGL